MEQLAIEQLEEISAPMSNDFWTGFAIGSGFVFAGAAVVIAIVT